MNGKLPEVVCVISERYTFRIPGVELSVLSTGPPLTTEKLSMYSVGYLISIYPPMTGCSTLAPSKKIFPCLFAVVYCGESPVVFVAVTFTLPISGNPTVEAEVFSAFVSLVVTSWEVAALEVVEATVVVAVFCELVISCA